MSAPAARQHHTLRLVLLALALGAGVAWHFLSRPVYYSRALLRVETAGNIERTRMLAKELTQPQLLERTASRLGTRIPASEIRKSYLFNLTAQPVSASEIEVKVWAYSKEWAARWTETLVAECQDFRRVRRRKEKADAIRALSREMAEIAAKLGDADAKKTESTDKAGLTRQLEAIKDLRNPARAIEPLAKRIEALSRVHADLLNPEIPMADKLSIIGAVERAAGTGETGSEPAWESIEERRRPLVGMLTLIENVSLAPEVTSLALSEEIEELDRKLQVEFDTNFRRFDVDYRNLVDQKAALEEKAARPSTPADVALNARLTQIEQRIENPVGNDAGDGSDPTYVGLRENTGRPVSPDALKIALVSLLGGGVLALGVPLIVDRFGPGRTKIGQLATSLDLPELGTVPVISGVLPRTPLLADAEDARLAPLHGIFENIRASLSAEGATPHVIMISSAMPGEGKTMVAANLGIAFAESGVRTLVIDTDLRRGRLHRLFGYRAAPGLGNVLAGEIPVAKAIRPTPRENLYVMNAGKAPGPGEDPLTSSALGQTIAQLRDSLDLLILDAPPVLGLTATATLAPFTDVTVLVIDPAQTSPKAAAAAKEMLRSSGAKMHGFVVNRAVI